jgi:hypothetical protein
VSPSDGAADGSRDAMADECVAVRYLVIFEEVTAIAEMRYSFSRYIAWFLMLVVCCETRRCTEVRTRRTDHAKISESR